MAVLKYKASDGSWKPVQTGITGSGDTPDLSGYATKQELNNKQDVIGDLQTIREGAAKGATAIQKHQSLEGYTKDSDLASVAKSGSYDDLKNKPSIPNEVTEATVSGWGFTKNTGTYSRPSGGIPKSDLDTSVQTSLGKADSAIQNIKTINGESLIGEGNLEILGGSIAYPILKPSSMPSELQPNTYYDLGQRAGFNINLAQGKEGVVNEYIFRLKVADSGSDLMLSDSIVWANGDTPQMTIGKSYEISIIDNMAVFVEF